MVREVEGPPPEAYGRVTNPERFGVVRHAAEVLAEQLARRPGVIRHDLEPDPDDAGPWADLVVELDPSPDRAAPIRITLTTFPGVHLRVGRWHEASFPACGCDACDEDPEDAIRTLHELVDAVVAGRFVEDVAGRWRTTELAGPGWSSTSRTRLERRVPRRDAVRIAWTPWDHEPPGAPTS